MIRKIYKYPNRTMYDKLSSAEVNHTDLINFIFSGYRIEVEDKDTGKDITKEVLEKLILKTSNQAMLPTIKTALEYHLYRKRLKKIKMIKNEYSNPKYRRRNGHFNITKFANAVARMEV